MKKNYNQPMVEAVEVQATSMLMEVSPGGINVDQTPIEYGDGGD